jgi:dolichyl-phosphate-mannose--protein O-mannosyl transferase
MPVGLLGVASWALAVGLLALTWEGRVGLPVMTCPVAIMIIMAGMRKANVKRMERAMMMMMMMVMVRMAMPVTTTKQCWRVQVTSMTASGVKEGVLSRVHSLEARQASVAVSMCQVSRTGSLISIYGFPV